MKQKVQVSFDINIDYPTIKDNTKVPKCIKEWAREWISGTEWSDFVPVFYDPDDEQYFNYPIKAKFNIKAKFDNKGFMNKKWEENEEDIAMGGNSPTIPLKQKKENKGKK